MRHYEILANGCIPVFEDLEQCPDTIMTTLPKQLILQCRRLFTEKCRSHDLLNGMIRKLIAYTRNHLTTRHTASYILGVCRLEDAKRILFLSGDLRPDYLRCMTLHGLKSILGRECHDYPQVMHLYKDTDSINEYVRNKTYCRGFTYSNLLPRNLHNNQLDVDIEKKILNRYFDAVIYGSVHRGMPFYDLVCSVYSMDKIILLCGEDEHRCDFKTYAKRGHSVFVRELIHD